MKNAAITAGILACLLLSTPLFADVITFVPSDADLGDLDHYFYYTWGMQLDEDETVIVTGAELKFKSIRNWNWGSNALYLNLLDEAPLGVSKDRDNQGGGNNFAGEGLLLHTYENLPPYPQTLTYAFDEIEMNTLSNYINNDGNFGIGADPDCHFYNCGVSLDVAYTTNPVPEPGTLLLLALGGIPAIMKLRRRARARAWA